ncbi:MAG: DNA-binding protein [Clostridia bacterium]|nr:DNA-binding protein [Clostridia bacterium]
MKDLQISLLIDFYGELLTEKQFDAIDKYYNEDLSLAEIALSQGITRQGVRDSIKRAESFLFDIEEKLKLARKLQEIRSGLKTIKDSVDRIEYLNNRMNISTEINYSVGKIKKTLKNLDDLY